MLGRLKRLFAKRPRYKPGPPPPPRLVISQTCIDALAACLAPEIRSGHEGIVYLLGQTDGTTTVVLAAIRPEARVTRGSFMVGAPAMAKVVRAAVDLGLQVVGQVHTHPGDAYHSGGDDDGARIAFTGYASIVLPDYGRHLPSLKKAATFFYRAGNGFVALDDSCVAIVPGRVV
jgi:proteasome lid subunit RPN8/RPN11